MADEVTSLTQQLASDDPNQRIKAREQLQELGPAAVPALIDLLDDAQQHVRWEAAKTLEAIADPRAMPKLVERLGDDDEEVRWVAGAALVAIGPASVEGICEGLIRTRDSEGFYKAAHHVLHDLAKKPKLQPMLTPLVAAFHTSEPQIAVPVAAEELLEELRD